MRLLAVDFDLPFALHFDAAGAFLVNFAERGPIGNDLAAEREIGPFDLVEQLGRGRIRLIHQVDAGPQHFTEVVRRHVGGHADRDARRAVDQDVGKLGRDDDRLLGLGVVGRPHLDGVLPQLRQQMVGERGQLGLGIPVSRGRIAIDRAEIALAIDERHPHHKVLRQPHQSVIRRLVAMGMVLARDLADDPAHLLGRFSAWRRSS